MPNNYVLLETIALTQSAASVTFDNLPTSGYTDLKIVMSARSDRNSFTSTYLNVSFNNSTSGYSSRVLAGNGTSALSYTNVEGTTGMGVMVLSQANNTANTFGNGELYIPNYTSGANKSVSADSVQESNETTGWQFLGAGLWSNTPAITSVKLQPISGGTNFNFLAGSTFSLYGIAALGTTPVLAPKATGGNIVANDGTYWYHAFTSSGNFVPQVGLTCDYLVVAGGGGGFIGTTSDQYGGGGGAGGLRSTVTATGGGGSLESAISVASGTNYPIIVGAGGPSGASGTNSTFSSITSTGGGYGNGISGGSGGGSRSITGGGAGGTASPSGQGFAGGTGTLIFGTASAAGGGGGAGAVGVNGNAGSGFGVAGNGGAGVSISAFASPTNTGVSNFYAGGGGGAGGGTNGSGGSGGGGAGDRAGVAGSGTNNTGGGGGGAYGVGGGTGTPGAGGSGIVIIRYPIA
jgi:hypothetical protein